MGLSSVFNSKEIERQQKFLNIPDKFVFFSFSYISFFYTQKANNDITSFLYDFFSCHLNYFFGTQLIFFIYLFTPFTMFSFFLNYSSIHSFFCLFFSRGNYSKNKSFSLGEIQGAKMRIKCFKSFFFK